MSPHAASVPSAGAANPASSPAVPAARHMPSHGTYVRGMPFMSAWDFGYAWPMR